MKTLLKFHVLAFNGLIWRQSICIWSIPTQFSIWPTHFSIRPTLFYMKCYLLLCIIIIIRFMMMIVECLQLVIFSILPPLQPSQTQSDHQYHILTLLTKILQYFKIKYFTIYQWIFPQAFLNLLPFCYYVITLSINF